MEKGEKVTRCMLLDMYLPSKIVTGVHLFQRRKRLLAGPLLGLDDLDDWRNGLLLFNPIKEAFDGLRIGFVYDATDDLYRLKLFDNSASFRNMAIIDFVPSKVIQNEMGLNISALPADWRSRQAPLLHENFQFDVRTTFADLEGKALAFKNLNRPFRDCLNLQARLAFKWAEKKGVSVSDFGDYWLDGMPPRVKTMVKTLNSMATN